MSVFDAIDPGPRRRVALVGALLAVSLGCVALLAYQAYRASRSHRAATDRAVAESVEFAAWSHAGAVRRALGSHLFDHAFERLEEGGEPGDVGFPTALADPARAPVLHFGEVAFWFRRDLRTGAVRFAGDPTPAAIAFVADSLESAPYDSRWHQGAALLDRGAMLLGWRFLPKTTEPERAVGFGVPFAAVEALLVEAFDQVPLLPPGRGGNRTNADRFAVRVLGPDGRLLHAAGTEPPAETAVRAADSVGAGFAGLEVRLAADPATAALVPGASPPPWRWPLLLGLFALVAALTGTAALLVRREQALARARTDFVSSVTHGLRTPLAQIRLYAETLALGRERSEAERERALQVIVQEAERLDRMVDDVLAFVRSAGPEPAQERRRTDLAALARETVNAFRPLAESRGTRLVVIGDDAAIGMADSTAVRKALSNLIDNALKYGPREQVVTIRIERRDGRVRLAVEDEGPGVPSESRSRVWRAFERLEVDRPTGGAGIGLAVVERIAVDHGGAVAVEEAPGGGARFVLALPAVEDPTPEGRREGERG